MRRLFWVASSKKDFAEFPASVQDSFGYERFLAQSGQHPPSAKRLTGLGTAVVELIEDYNGDIFRAVYTVKFKHVIYVLHAFKKKSKQGIKTPQSDIQRIQKRLKEAQSHYVINFETETLS